MGRAFPGGIGPVRGSSSLVFCLGESCGGEVVCRRRGCGQREGSGNGRGEVGGFGPLLWGYRRKRGASSSDRMRSAVGHRGGGRTDPWEGGGRDSLVVLFRSGSSTRSREATVGDRLWGRGWPLSRSPDPGRTGPSVLRGDGQRGGPSGAADPRAEGCVYCARILPARRRTVSLAGRRVGGRGGLSGRAGGGWERWPGSTRCSGLSGRGGSSSRSVRMRALGRPMRGRESEVGTVDGHCGGGRTDPWRGGRGFVVVLFRPGLSARARGREGGGSFVGAGLAPLPLSGSRAYGTVRPEGGRTARRALGRGGSSGRG